MEIGVIGGDLFTTGFRLVGIHKCFAVDDTQTVDEAVAAALADPELGVLVIHDAKWRTLDGATRQKLSNSVRPTVIAIGAELDDTLRGRIRSAVGVDLWN